MQLMLMYTTHMNKSKLTIAFFAGMLIMFSGTVVAQQFGGLMFPDVLPNDYFFDSVTRFAKKGTITGYDSGRFGPHDYVTRGQVAVILDRYDQQTVNLMRNQIAQIRDQMGLGSCGDNVVQVGEECDDGNALSGDGCTLDCQEEVHCSGGYKIGDRFPAPDGCNTCSCTESGIACTERACTQTKCFSSAECAASDICSVEQGDCRYPCPAGAVCIQACAGVCIPRSSTSICGNGTCEDGETAFPDRTGTSLYCPQDCDLGGPICGNGLCEEGESDEYKFNDSGPELLRRGTCPDDCEGGLTSCQQKKRSLDILFDKNVACDKDADCTIFARGCSPYLTCGKAVIKNELLNITSEVIQYVDECSTEEPTLCASCLPNEAKCISNVCTVVQKDS